MPWVEISPSGFAGLCVAAHALRVVPPAVRPSLGPCPLKRPIPFLPAPPDDAGSLDSYSVYFPSFLHEERLRPISNQEPAAPIRKKKILSAGTACGFFLPDFLLESHPPPERKFRKKGKKCGGRARWYVVFFGRWMCGFSSGRAPSLPFRQPFGSLAERSC